MVALGTTAPEESLRIPVNAPVDDDWLQSEGTNSTENKNSSAQLKLKMPPDESLRPEEVAGVVDWIRHGAPWPAHAGI